MQRRRLEWREPSPDTSPVLLYAASVRFFDSHCKRPERRLRRRRCLERSVSRECLPSCRLALLRASTGEAAMKAFAKKLVAVVTASLKPGLRLERRCQQRQKDW